MRFALILLLAVSAFASPFGHNTGLFAADAESLAALRQQKLAAAKEWYEATIVAAEAGTARAPDLYDASIAWKEAAFEIATTKRERLRAIEEHRDRMTKLYDKSRILRDVDGGFPLEGELVLQFGMCEANVWLREETAKP